jgi:hypothetical protein
VQELAMHFFFFFSNFWPIPRANWNWIYSAFFNLEQNKENINLWFFIFHFLKKLVQRKKKKKIERKKDGLNILLVHQSTSIFYKASHIGKYDN